MSDEVLCSQFGRCGGCGWGGRALADQHAEKLAAVRDLFADVKLVYSPAGRVRDRADLIWQEVAGQRRLGLYGLNVAREVVDLEACPMMSDRLEAFLKDFRKVIPPVRLGSVRLRVGPRGLERGAWLDFSNNDVKTLFEERSYLRALGEMAFVEIGQRRKALAWREDGSPRLIDPVLKPWFETYAADGSPIPLYGPVGGFSQTGFASNRALVSAVCAGVESTGVSSWLEMFCGNGNFTLALAAQGKAVEAVEMDELALEGLGMSLASLPEPQASRMRELVKFARADVYLKTKSLPSMAGRGLLVDPPRAGLRELLDVLRASVPADLPKAIVYVSCFTDVFLKDVAVLRELGFQVRSLVGVDQFPHSPHAEWVAVLTQ